MRHDLFRAGVGHYFGAGLSIRLRNLYVDPLSLLQVELLRRWRKDGREDEALLRALVSTVNGIAAGIQNTG